MAFIRFPDEMGSEAKSVMTGLLQRDPNRRLGNGGAEEIKKHPFFARHIDWNRYVSIFAFEPAAKQALPVSY
jgi:serum/glucocorticoid-regulated kinase 2